MIPWYTATVWFLLGVLLARHAYYRRRGVMREEITVSRSRKHDGWVRLEFDRFGHAYDMPTDCAREIGVYLMKMADATEKRAALMRKP